MMSEKDREMITHPDRWPQWPMLPLVEGQLPNVKCGILVDNSEDPYSVWNGNMCDPLQIMDKWDDFETLEELLASNWRVD